MDRWFIRRRALAAAVLGSVATTARAAEPAGSAEGAATASGERVHVAVAKEDAPTVADPAQGRVVFKVPVGDEPAAAPKCQEFLFPASPPPSLTRSAWRSGRRTWHAGLRSRGSPRPQGARRPPGTSTG